MPRPKVLYLSGKAGVPPCVGAIGGIGGCYQQPGGVGGLAPRGDCLHMIGKHGVSAYETCDDGLRLARSMRVRTHVHALGQTGGCRGQQHLAPFLSGLYLDTSTTRDRLDI